MITTPNQQEDNALGHILSQRLTLNWELAAYIVILVLALFSRFHMLDARVMSHDESLHTRFAYNLYNEGNFQHTPLMHGPVLFHATAFSFYSLRRWRFLRPHIHRLARRPYGDVSPALAPLAGPLGRPARLFDDFDSRRCCSITAVISVTTFHRSSSPWSWRIAS